MQFLDTKRYMNHKHHIIENQNGKRVRTDKLMNVSVTEHTNIHKKYYEQWGFEEDLIAYKGLSGQIGKEKIQEQLSSLGGKNNIGKLKSKEHKNKIALHNIGKKHTEDSKKRISKSMKGNTNSNGSNQFSKKNI